MQFAFLYFSLSNSFATNFCGQWKIRTSLLPFQMWDNFGLCIILIFWADFCHRSGSLDIEMVSLLPYAAPIAPALVWTGAGLELAVQRANRLYGPYLNISLKLLYDKDYRGCDGPDTTDMFAEYYYKIKKPEVCPAMVGSGKRGPVQSSRVIASHKVESKELRVDSLVVV